MRRTFSVAVYPRHAGRVLLIHHKRLGIWLPPGGECEAGETPLEAARRELVEETGLVGEFPILSDIEGTPPGLIGYEEHIAGNKGQHLNFVFVADVTSDAVVPNDEFSEFRWADTMEGVGGPANVAQLGRLALTAQPSLLGVARRWLACFNARDLDGLLALYDPAAVHISPKLRARDPSSDGRVTGHAALRAWWQGSFERLPSLRYRERTLCADGERVWMEYDRVLDGEPTLLVAEVLEVRAGRIVGSRVFHG